MTTIIHLCSVADCEREARIKGLCKRCYAREYMRRRYAENPERYREAARVWSAANREKVNKQSKESRERRIETVRAYDRARARDPARREKNRTLLAANHDRYAATQRAKRLANPEKYRDQKRAWREKNLQRVKDNYRRWYAANRDADKAHRQAYHDAHPEKRKAIWQKWRDANEEYNKARQSRYKEQRLEYNRKRYYANRELARQKNRAYQAAHPEVINTIAARRRARKQAAAGDFTAADWLALVAKSPRCHWCGRKWTKTRKPTHDHVIALSKGGPNSPENSVAACSECNTRKHNKRVHPVTGQGILL